MFAIAECTTSGRIEVGRILPVLFSSEEKARVFLDAFLKQKLCQDGAAASVPATYEITPLSEAGSGKCPYHPISGCPVRFPV